VYPKGSTEAFKKRTSEQRLMKAKFLYVGIRVKDLDESLGFYTKLLGMKLTGRAKIDVTQGEVASVVSEDGGFALELNYYWEGSPYAAKYEVGEGLDHLCFQVEDFDEFLRLAKEMGYPVVKRIKTDSSSWAYIEDPNGIWLEIVA
jgi:lactoylglutathione lyase